MTEEPSVVDTFVETLKSLLDEKLDLVDAFSGSYNDLTNKPSIPSKTSDLTNDSGFLTQHQSLSNYVEKSQTSGLLKNDGTIDTSTYLTQHQDITGKESILNKVTSLSSSSTDTQYPSAKCVYDTIDNISSRTNIQIIEEGTTITNNGFYLVVPLSLSLVFTGSEFEPLDRGDNFGLTGSNMVIDWGDGTNESIASNTKFPSHTYSENGTYTIQVTGEITSIEHKCFMLADITSVNIPSTVTSLKDACFYDCGSLSNVTIPLSVTSIGSNCFGNCDSLTNITIPSSITSIGSNCFRSCDNLIDYQLYWQDPPITWNDDLMQNNTNTYYTIPYGTTANYVAKSFPSNKLIERSA